MTSEAPVVTQALEYSRMADPEAWANAESGKHSRENNIRLAQANAMGKARYLSELLAGFSQSQFVEAAASENGENLLNALVGVLSDYPNHRQSADSHHRLIEALRECGQAIEVLFETADDRVTGVSCIALDMLKDAAKNARQALKETPDAQ